VKIREHFSASWEKQLARIDERERRRERKLPGWRDRRHRRPLVLVMLLGCVLLVVAAVGGGRGQPWLFAALWWSGLVVWSTGFLLLRTLTGKMTSSFSSLLDEREREWRHRVTYIGHCVLSGLMVVSVFYGFTIAEQEDASWRATLMTAALLVLGISTPTLVLGWTLPDDDPDDFADPPAATAQGKETRA
jgi:hypothetical protein